MKEANIKKTIKAIFCRFTVKSTCSLVNVCSFSFRMTNGGKTTLATSLQEQIPNSCIIAQDSYFKVDCEAVFKPYCYFSSLGASITYASFFRMTLKCQWTAMGSSNMTVRTICFTLYYNILDKTYLGRIIGKTCGDKS